MAQGVRNRIHHVLWGESALDAELAEASGLLPLARFAKALELIAYLERLASYREVRRVPESEVAQRVRDLPRSRPGPEDVTGIERRGSAWCVPLVRANLRPGTLHIDAESGRMFARED